MLNSVLFSTEGSVGEAITRKIVGFQFILVLPCVDLILTDFKVRRPNNSSGRLGRPNRYSFLFPCCIVLFVSVSVFSLLS